MTLTKDVEGIILSVQDYREYDVLVSILLNDEIQTFMARGIHKPNSKNRLLVRPFTYVHVTLTQSKLYQLTTGNVIESYPLIYEDLTIQSVLNVLVDCLHKTHVTPSMFEAFHACLKAFQTGEANSYTWACILVKEVLKEEGISIFVDGCVQCHRKDHIETISIQDGGFLCTTCNHGRIRKYEKEELIQFRSLFAYKPNQTEAFVNMYTFTIDQFLFLVKWFMYHNSIHLNSFQFLQSIINL